MQANNKMQELHTQLERLGNEQLQLETRITELLPYQSEVTKLKGDLLKMQVNKTPVESIDQSINQSVNQVTTKICQLLSILSVLFLFSLLLLFVLHLLFIFIIFWLLLLSLLLLLLQ